CHPDQVIVRWLDVAELCFVPSLRHCPLRTIRPSSPTISMELQWESQWASPAAPFNFFCINGGAIYSIAIYDTIKLDYSIPTNTCRDDEGHKDDNKDDNKDDTPISESQQAKDYFAKPGNYFMMDVIDHSGNIFISYSEIYPAQYPTLLGLPINHVWTLRVYQTGVTLWHLAALFITSCCAVEGAQLIVIVDQYPTSAMLDNTHTAEQSQSDDEKGAHAKSIKYIINSETPTVFAILDGGVGNKQTIWPLHSDSIQNKSRTSTTDPTHLTAFSKKLQAFSFDHADHKVLHNGKCMHNQDHHHLHNNFKHGHGAAKHTHVKTACGNGAKTTKG
ncbi:hypothetical protein EI94DRAFT_1708788, partial [Lactarius quietus]